MRTQFGGCTAGVETPRHLLFGGRKKETQVQVTVNPEYVVWVERLTNEKIASFIDTPLASVKSIARAMSKESAYKDQTIVVENFEFGMVSSYENGNCIWSDGKP